jgi:hypothetical protein
MYAMPRSKCEPLDELSHQTWTSSQSSIASRCSVADADAAVVVGLVDVAGREVDLVAAFQFEPLDVVRHFHLLLRGGVADGADQVYKNLAHLTLRLK